jgi:citrate lyase subunit beta/citryl-CoA lyase
MLDKARTFKSDALVLDLEDSVPTKEKDAALSMVVPMIKTLAELGHIVFVRVNSFNSGRTRKELEAVVCKELYGISLGKVNSSWAVTECDKLLSGIEINLGLERSKVKVIPWIESAAGVLNVRSISNESDRVIALAFGGEDFTNDMGIRRSYDGSELMMPKSIVSMAARASSILALDTPFVNFRDLNGLREECNRSANLGFKGKFSIHPGQLETINEVFRPNIEDVEYARRVVAAWSEAVAKGLGSLELEGAMVDIPVVKRAEALLQSLENMEQRELR